MTDWLGIDKLILLRKKRQTETCLFYGFIAAQEVIVSSIIFFDLQPIVSHDHQNSDCALGDL